MSTIKINNVSEMAATLIPSEIIRLNNEINQKKKLGKRIYNLTIGDFDPRFFPIPKELENEIINAYQEGHTNYPPAHGVAELRNTLSAFLESNLNLKYNSEEILISGGSRPLIYALFRTLLDPGDSVIYALPSWNNNHYCHLTSAKKIEIETSALKNFMPTAADLVNYIPEASLLALCSPQNPTGTVFEKKVLSEICKLVLEENNRRKGIKKPLYIMYDQMYWQLCFGETKHHHPLEVCPELKQYVIYIDGLSKAYAGTGVRVGWSFGPAEVIAKMRAILSHVGAWAPKAEQIATSRFLNDVNAVNKYMNFIKPEIENRLISLYNGILSLKLKSYPIDAIPPQAAIYLTARFPWVNKKTKEGKLLKNQHDVTSYLLDDCEIAIVPFYAFGASADSDWYRISVGTLDKNDISTILSNIKKGIDNFE
ncbi:MAG: aminotransferase class I/II-fold pyridoxal phosphate-dependent enzyme [Saprospiraceae bacterium]|nr:aminotransferase class I/II-fold pyridoxal phosphate-dependent enzyme [Saprospiraceae bacterium]